MAPSHAFMFCTQSVLFFSNVGNEIEERKKKTSLVHSPLSRFLSFSTWVRSLSLSCNTFMHLPNSTGFISYCYPMETYLTKDVKELNQQNTTSTTSLNSLFQHDVAISKEPWPFFLAPWMLPYWWSFQCCVLFQRSLKLVHFQHFSFISAFPDREQAAWTQNTLIAKCLMDEAKIVQIQSVCESLLKL